MTIAVNSVACRCRARLGRPCRERGNHLARYLTAEATGVISYDQLKAMIATLTVLAPHIVITDDRGDADRAELHEVRSP
jgi:hypothetical protein